MRELISIVEQALRSGDKIHRNAFLYLESNKKNDQFAQCSTCIMWISGAQRCTLFGPDHQVVGNGSCNFYIEGSPKLQGKTLSKTNPTAAGYLDAQVRCENCSWFNSNTGVCGLFKTLNDQLPDVFDLNQQVKPLGCCNAWQKK